MADVADAERLLGHRVAAAVTGSGSGVMIAASVGGDPPCTRLAWIDWAGPSIVARLACPPARPSRIRPVVATDLAVVQAGIDARVLAVRAADGIEAVRIVTAAPDQPAPLAVPERVGLVELDHDLTVLAVDALGQSGEPVGRLDAAGIGAITLSAGRMSGRLGAGHGMAAGFGAGRWVDTVKDAEFEAGRALVLPRWVPEGLERGRFHVEPDVAYPAAPPAIVVAWGREPTRVLLRQAAGPLANPDARPGRATPVAIGGATGALMSRRRFATLVWEDAELVFGVQVQGLDDPAAVAERVAASM